MPSVAFLPYVKTGGTREYRCAVPAAALERAGWDAQVVDDPDTSFDADVIVFQRTLDSWVLPLIERIRRQRPDIVVVYDIDDNLDAIPAYNPARKGLIGMVEYLHQIMRAVDVITVTSPALAEHYCQFNHVIVLENYLDPALWRDFQTSAPLRDKIHIGWRGAMDWKLPDLELIKPWIGNFLVDHPECQFVSCGAGPELLAHLGIPGLVSPECLNYKGQESYLWPYHSLPAMLKWLDIGLTPLIYNSFNQAKSHCAALEMNGAGAVVVASPSREYRRYIRPGVNGYLVRHNEWRAALEKALANLDELKLGVESVVKDYWIDDHITKWMLAYEWARNNRK